MEHIFITLLTLSAYFLPSLIAIVRKHHNVIPIVLTNTLLGWTLIIWLVALIWAFTNQKATQVIINNGSVK